MSARQRFRSARCIVAALQHPNELQARGITTDDELWAHLTGPDPARVATIAAALGSTEERVRAIVKHAAAGRLASELDALSPGALAAAGHIDDDAISKYLKEPNAARRDLVTALGMDEQQFLTVLTENTIGLAETYGPNSLEKKWFDWARAGVAVAVLFLLGVLTYRMVETPCRPRIVAARDLLPFRALTAADIALKSCANDAAAQSRVRSLFGKYVVSEVDKGKDISDANLSARALPAGMGNYGMIRVAAREAGASKPWKFPFDADLLLSPRDLDAGKDPLVVPHVYVLSANDAGASTLLWLAVPNDRIGAVAGLLGGSDVYLSVHPAR